jgi:hypothetical protein
VVYLVARGFSVAFWQTMFEAQFSLSSCFHPCRAIRPV